MVDTAIFSIFHRAPPPPAPPPPEAAEPVAAPPAESIVQHPLFAIPVLARGPAPSPQPAEPTPPQPSAEASQLPSEAVEGTADHPEIPVEKAIPVRHAPVEPPPAEPEASVEELPAAKPVDDVVAAAHSTEDAVPEFEPELAEHESTDILEVSAELEPSDEPAAEEAPEAEVEPVVALQPAAHDLAFDQSTAPEPLLNAAEQYHEPAEYAPIEPPAPHWAAQLPPADAPQEPVQGPVWHGPAKLANIPVEADQLGLANPIVITLLARLRDSSSVALDASQSGIYRPQTFRAAPWSGFAYDQAADGRTGLAVGTRILTARGEMEVEKLLPGDTVMTLRAPALLPIAWIGKSVATAAPIWIEAGALGPNLPRRGLCLAPDQPVYVEPIPVPAARLVNGTTIRVVETEDVDLFHVDVGKSEILFAEGLPLSSGDRLRLQRA